MSRRDKCEEGKHQLVDQVFAGLDLLERQLRPLEPHALGEVVPRDFLHQRDRLARAYAGRRVAVDLGGRVHLVAVDDRRPGDVADRGDAIQRNHRDRCPGTIGAGSRGSC